MLDKYQYLRPYPSLYAYRQVITAYTRGLTRQRKNFIHDQAEDHGAKGLNEPE